MISIGNRMWLWPLACVCLLACSESSTVANTPLTGGADDVPVATDVGTGLVDAGGAVSDAGTRAQDTGKTAEDVGATTPQDTGSGVATDSGGGVVDSGGAVAEDTAGSVDTGGGGAVDSGSGAADAGSVTEPDISSQPDIGGGPVDAGSGGSGKIDKMSEHSAKCSKASDCKIPCAQGSCDSGVCKYTPAPSACIVDLGGDKVACYGNGMSSKAAPCLRCNTKVSQTSLTSLADGAPVNEMDEGFVIEDLSAGKKGAIVWSMSSKRSVSGGKSLYFGDPKTGMYANDKHVNSSVTTPSLEVPSFPGAKPSLRFWLWMETEQSKGYDLLLVKITSGGKSQQVWTSDVLMGSTDQVWKPVDIDITAWAGKSIKAVFTFDSKDGYVNAFEGAYIDDISVQTGCCGAVSDCNDGNACTTDTCAPGAGGLPVCGHKDKANCCNSNKDCDDGKPCTVDLCDKAGGSCKNSVKPGCCLKSADCDDKDSCTVDHCPKPGAQCQHTNTCCKSDAECTSQDPCLKGACVGGDCSFSSTCCNGDDECDDFNPCTKDACVKSKCVHTPSIIPGCCSPEPHVNDYESDIEGWKSDPAIGGFT